MFDNIAGLLTTAAKQVLHAKENHPDDLDSPAWRIADALLLIKELTPGPEAGYGARPGIDEPTGRDAKLEVISFKSKSKEG